MREIVGSVGNAKQAVFPNKQLSWNIGTIVLRTAGLPLEVEPAARSMLMVVTSLAAAYLPAMRAASVDPTQALRTE